MNQFQDLHNLNNNEMRNFIDLNKIFFNKKVNLGLDLQGGSYLLLEVDSSSIEKRRLQSKVVPIKKKLRENCFFRVKTSFEGPLILAKHARWTTLLLEAPRRAAGGSTSVRSFSPLPERGL